MATENNPTRVRKRIFIAGDGEYQDGFISRRSIQSPELIILEPIYTRKDYFKALFYPDKFDVMLFFASVLSLLLLKGSLKINTFHPSALIFIGIFGIFFYTTRFAYFSVGDLFARMQKNQDPHKLVNELDFDFSFWGLLFNLVLIGIGVYLLG